VKKKITITALITLVKRVMTKSGHYMMTGELEDGTAKVSFVAFPKVYEKVSVFLRESGVIRAEGFLEERSGALQFILNDASAVSLDSMIEAARKAQVFDENELIVGVARLEWNHENETSENPVIEIPERTTTETLTQLKSLLEAHPGDEKISLHMKVGAREKKVDVPFGVKFDASLKDEIEKLLKVST
jgi:DNA polymerase III alpha subunit